MYKHVCGWRKRARTGDIGVALMTELINNVDIDSLKKNQENPRKSKKIITWKRFALVDAKPATVASRSALLDTQPMMNVVLYSSPIGCRGDSLCVVS